MSRWIPRASRVGIEYGGAQSQWYWNFNYNYGATPANCMANCTTYAFGRMLEAGDLPPVPMGFPDADRWHEVLTNGWTYTAYNFADLKAGDILEWSNGMKHVAVVEEVGTSPYNYYRVSESLYTARDESLSLSQISAYMIANYPNRFFYYGQGTSAYSATPTYILHNPNPHTADSPLLIVPRKRNKRRRLIYV